ncbi:unnamed protein product [Paramecium sonneborni]|uniref:MORN repeat-containing protein 5 n=1 Tax=Paramecium sonneborni TaxID=65129 RepID=A0A8S1QA81_9CILI|nr:unnamed protein product [Paramecium sonneborni]
MSKWAESKYEGEQLEGWFHGKGKYYFSNGVIYEGDFFKGEFHGDGTLIFPNGGQYKAKWERGKMLDGTYFFEDHLKYEPIDWKYCIGDDRRFHQEIKQSIKPAGITQMTKDDILIEIPEGTYDVGEGYYEPVKSIIYRYDGSILRTPSEPEVENILKKCRYNPKKDFIIDGKNDKVIQKMTQKSQ